jgi:hypothetical protein
MARLIPAFMEDRTPPGEKDVFSLLAAGPDDWIALHALDLAPWNRGLRTEIDFVVLVPERGILCIEVKSHDRIAFDGNRWHPESIRRSPFKQACDGSHTFHRRLVELAPRFRDVPVVHCCIFPRATFELTPNLSIQRWEVMDSREFRSFGSATEFCAELGRRIELGIAANGKLSRLARPMTRADLDAIVSNCVPIQRFHPNAREEIKQRELDLSRVLLEQQKPALELAKLNPRIVVSGGAGTGKTLIATELARRIAEAGNRVAFLCFNQLVGDVVTAKIEHTSPRLPNLLAGRAIRVLAELAGVKIPQVPPPTFWSEDLPSELEDRLTDPDFEATAAFDYLVLDEAQDILARPWLWNCLLSLLPGGLESGRFALFGDFEHQALLERDAMLQTLASVCSSSHASRWRLSENCRNYRIVGDTAVRLAGIASNIYEGYRRTGGGLENYNIHFYQDDREQIEVLTRTLAEFRARGYKPSEISILSFRSDELSAAWRLRQSGHNLRPAWQATALTSYCSVHAFKGMENKVVILTDMVLDDRAFARDLFYTGMTRATESVRVLSAVQSQQTIVRWLSEGLKQ